MKLILKSKWNSLGILPTRGVMGLELCQGAQGHVEKPRLPSQVISICPEPDGGDLDGPRQTVS